jgi:hypothetical protein
MGAFKFGFVVAIVAVAIVCIGPSRLAASETQLLTPVAAQQGESGDYVVYESVPINFKKADMTGFLQILQDKRVTLEYRQKWGMSADPEMALGPNDPLVKSIKNDPLQNGRLRLIDRQGRVISVESLGEPLAEIKTDYLYGTKFPTYLLSVYYGVGMGSYAGPATTLVEVREGKLIHIPVTFGQSLKNGWKIVPALTGAGKEIEVVQCHPNFENPKWADADEFVVVYSIYRFANGQWRRTSFEKKGFWESDDPWPPRSAFP